MLSAICRICFFEWVRALRGLGLRSAGEPMDDLESGRLHRLILDCDFDPSLLGS